MRRGILQLLLPVSIVCGALSGCALGATVIHPVYDSDIKDVPVGTKIGNTTTTKTGWYLSDEYLKEVVNAKVKK